MYVDKSKTYLGIVEENDDPKKLGRCRIRVIDIFDEIPVEDIPWASPWKDLNGNAFNVPEKGKIIMVVFDLGNIYKPEYICAEHFNVNLENKLKTLDDENYTSMKALIFDHKTQIYVNDKEGLKFDYKFNLINITKDEINLNLRDNFGKVNIGTPTANQQVILGNHFLNWFDEFIDNLLGIQGGPFLGNLGSAVIPNPSFIAICQKYKSLKDPKFLSHHINLVDNEYVQKQDRTNSPTLEPKALSGDPWKSTVRENELTTLEEVDYKSREGNSTDTPSPDVGNLTTTSDINGSENENTIVNDPGPIQASNNPDVNILLATMKQKNYVILDKPYQMNIIGIRRQYEGMRYSNAFIDDLYLIFKIDNSDKWQIRKYSISTMPGYYKALEVRTKEGDKIKDKIKREGYKLKPGESWTGNTPNGQPVDVKSTSIMQSRGGMGILANAQYIDIYEIAEHSGKPAMKTGSRKQKAYRDKLPGDIIRYTSQNEGAFAMYIHRGYDGGVSVNNWSEGCQVFSKDSELQDFFRWCNMHKDKYGNRFNYTLMLERDLVSRERSEVILKSN